MRRHIPSSLLLLALVLASTVSAASLEQLLAQPTAPAGIVFEVVQSDGDALAWALPKVRAHTQHLRERFPGLPIALVTHGREQFSLLSAEQESYPAIQGMAREMVTDEAIDIHVCGTYAERRGNAPEDFIDVIDVAAAGPQQIEDYEALGYVRVIIRRD